MPHALEIHFRLWDPEAEGIAAEDMDGLVASADVRDFSGLRIRALPWWENPSPVTTMPGSWTTFDSAGSLLLRVTRTTKSVAQLGVNGYRRDQTPSWLSDTAATR